MKEDIGVQLKLSEKIIQTQLRPNIIIYSDKTMQIMLELIVRWEEKSTKGSLRNIYNV